jgi:hypothetical protein
MNFFFFEILVFIPIKLFYVGLSRSRALNDNHNAQNKSF